MTTLVVATAVIGGLGSGCVRESDPSPSRVPWTTPGLVDADGRPWEVREPAPAAAGAMLDVTAFGADPDAGSDDDARALRAAVDAAHTGDTVVIPAGTYDLRSADPDDDSTNVTLHSGVHVRGAGPGATVLRSDFDGDDDSAVLRGVAVEDVSVSGLRITSDYGGSLGTDPEDDSAGGGPMYGIQIGEEDGRGSARVLVEDVRVDRFQRHGITAKASREVTVRGCHVSDATSVGPGGAGYGIAIEGRADQRDPDAVNDSRHNAVVDNVLGGEHLRHAILLQFPTHNNLVAGNEITGSVLDAIDLHGEGEYLNEIRGNTVTGGERAGVALGNSGGATHEHGASGEGNWVHDNVLVGNDEGVIVILGTPDTRVEENRIEGGVDSSAGIVLDDAPGSVVRGNSVSGGGDDFEPLRVDDPGDVTVEGNDLDAGGG